MIHALVFNIIQLIMINFMVSNHITATALINIPRHLFFEVLDVTLGCNESDNVACMVSQRASW